MSRIKRAGVALLGDPERFSALVLRQPLRRYQLAPLRAILDSVLNHRGLEFLLIFPRQAGKNETVAHLLTYLLNLYQRAGGNIVYGAIGDQLGMGIDRVEARLDNVWNLGQWAKAVKPTRRILGRAAIIFISSHPMASARGQTAHHLVVIDETQDQDAAHIETVFTPMRASTNATALYIGTVRTTSDFLWQKKLELERETARDGIQRVYLVTPDQVTREVPAYNDFLDTQIRKHGRNHPIVASEYFLEPIDAAGGLFPERRRLLMRGAHSRIHSPLSPAAPTFTPLPGQGQGRAEPEYPSGELYVATVDVAGEDEAATDPVARLARPGRDYTVATIFRVLFPDSRFQVPGPGYWAVDVFVDHGSKHFEEHPGRPPLSQRLFTWLQMWHVAHIVADESGVGAGLVSWLAAAFGPNCVTGYNFSGPGKKAALGAAFLSLIETHRFKYWTDDEYITCSDGWWFWRQAEACGYELPPGGTFERDLRWEVPATHKTSTPTGIQATHDDRLLSAALVAELDRLVRAGDIALGRAASAVVPGRDPLEDMSF